MLRDTNADGIAVGRGAVGNPFVFDEILATLGGREYCEPDINERVETALYQLRTAVEEKGERMAIPEARKQIALYLRSFHGAARIRAEINRATTYKEVEIALSEMHGTPVRISYKDGKGTLNITFNSQEQLLELANLLEKK